MNPDNIIWCEAQKNYTVVHLADRATLMPLCRTLKSVEKELRKHGFVRIHHSYIINTAYLTDYVNGKGGYVVLNKGREIKLEVSYSRKKPFLAAFTIL